MNRSGLVQAVDKGGNPRAHDMRPYSAIRFFHVEADVIRPPSQFVITLNKAGAAWAAPVLCFALSPHYINIPYVLLIETVHIRPGGGTLHVLQSHKADG